MFVAITDQEHKGRFTRKSTSPAMTPLPELDELAPSNETRQDLTQMDADPSELLLLARICH